MGMLTTLLRFSGDASGAVQAMNDVTGKMGGFASGFTQAGQTIEKAGSGMVRAGAGIGFIAAPATAALTAIISSGLELESVMHQIEAVSGESAQSLKGLEAEIMKTGKALPVSTKEAADLAYSLSTLGFNSAEVTDQLDGVARLAVANRDKLGDLSQAGALVGSVIRGFGMDTKDTNQVLDLLTTITDKSAAEITDLTYSMKYVAPSAGAAHQSLAEMSTAIGIMANVGIKGEMSGVALRNTLTRLLVPTKEARKVLEGLGIVVTDSSGKMLPFTEIIDQFRVAMEGATDEETAFIAKTIAGEGGIAGFMSLVNASPKDWNAMRDAMYEAAEAEGAVIDKRVDIMLKGSTGNIEQMKGSLETLAVTLFQKLAPAVEKVTGALFKMVNWFLELPPETLSFIAKAMAGFVILFGALTAILVPLGMLAMSIGALMPIFGVIAAGLGAVAGAMGITSIASVGLGGAFTIMLGPVGLIIAAIAALIAIGILVWQNWDSIQQAGQNLMAFLGELIANFIETVRGFSDMIPPLKLVVAVFDWFTGKKQFNIADLLDILTDFIPPLNLFKQIWGWLAGNKSIKFDMNAIQSLLNLPKLVWNAFIKGLDWFKFVPDLLWNMFAKLLEWQKFIEGLKWQLFLRLLEWAQFIGNLLWNGFINLLSWASFIGDLLWDTFMDILNWVDFIGDLAWGSFINLLSWVSFIANLAWDTFLDLLSWVDFIGDLAWDTFMNLLDWALFIGDLLWDTFMDILSWVDFIGDLVWTSFIDALSWLSFVGDLAWSTFVDFLGGANGWWTFVSELGWGTFIDFLGGVNGWWTFVSGLAWDTFIDFLGGATGWWTFVSSLSWSSFMDFLGGANGWWTFVSSLSWSSFVDAFGGDKGWWTWIGSLSWGSFVPGVSWPNWGDLFWQWINQFNPFGGGSTSQSVSTMGLGGMSIMSQMQGVFSGARSSYNLTANYAERQSASSILADLQAMEMAARMRAGR